MGDYKPVDDLACASAILLSDSHCQQTHPTVSRPTLLMSLCQHALVYAVCCKTAGSAWRHEICWISVGVQTC